MAKVVWIQGATDNGCLVSFLNSQEPDLYQLLEKMDVNILYQNTLNPTSGSDILSELKKCASGEEEFDILIIEGGVPRGPNGTGMACFIGDKTFAEWVNDLAPKAKYVIAVGTCASFGNIPAAGPNPTDVTGVQWSKTEFGGFLGKKFKSQAGLPVINISGCPAHPDWIVQTLVALLLGRLPEIDKYNRPNDFYDENRTVHDGCPRNEYYTFMVAAENFCDEGCLYGELGCQGPHTHSDCNRRLWNRQNSLTRCGIPCHGCTNPDFPESSMPFFKRQELSAEEGWKAVTRSIGSKILNMGKPKRLSKGDK